MMLCVAGPFVLALAGSRWWALRADRV
jgi:hypothetical protein